MSITLEPLTAFGPTAKGDRLVNIDFVRGIALLGILLVNVAVMFGPLAAITDPTYQERLSPPDRVAALLVVSFCQFKFISTFSLLFGYGLYGQMNKAADSGRSAVGFTFRRLFILLCFGAIHALFFWFGDVLFIYACIGAWLLLARNARPRTLILVGVVILAFALLLGAGLQILSGQADSRQAPPLHAPPNVPNSVAAMFASGFNPSSPVWIDAETTAYQHGPWIDAQIFRTASWLFSLIATVIYVGWLVLGMFFLGAALWRVRFFAPEQRGLRWRVCCICLPLGVAFEAAAAYYFWSYPPSNLQAWMTGHVIQQVGLFFLPLGYVSGFSLLAERLPTGLTNAVASAGRMSLTVYLSETLLATGLAYHWGAQLFGVVGAAQQVGFAFAIWGSLVVFSTLWLKRFSYGPMEWLWRRLEYGPAPVPGPALAPVAPAEAIMVRTPDGAIQRAGD